MHRSRKSVASVLAACVLACEAAEADVAKRSFDDSGTDTEMCTPGQLTDVQSGEAPYPPEDECGPSDGGATGATSSSTDTSEGDTGSQCADDPPFDLGTRTDDPKTVIYINNGTNAAIVVTVTISHPCVTERTIFVLEVPRNKTVHVGVGNDLDAEGWTTKITRGDQELTPTAGKRKVKWKIGDTTKTAEVKAKTVTLE